MAPTVEGTDLIPSDLICGDCARRLGGVWERHAVLPYYGRCHECGSMGILTEVGSWSWPRPKEEKE